MIRGDVMADSSQSKTVAHFACVPHVPFIVLQDREANRGFWDAYEKQAQALREFDPELVIVFGADHYSGMHLKLMPTFLVGQQAEAIADDGGYPGSIDVPPDLALQLAEYLVEHEFDIATSWAMEVDHGFTSVLHHFLGAIDARPVLPVFINSLACPRPSLRRCRQLGHAVGTFAAALGKRVAFLGSGGLSHETGDIFPQYGEAADEGVRDYVVHGGAKGSLSRETWLKNMHEGLQQVNRMLLDRVPGVGQIRPEWDDKFLRTFSAGDLTAFDTWSDRDLLANGGNGAGEVRQWIAAFAAAQAAGVTEVSVDYYQHDLPMGVAAVVVHG
jgi:2,3-dihydroxyphenylpropionate 1,2-dioxygenase